MTATAGAHGRCRAGSRPPSPPLVGSRGRMLCDAIFNAPASPPPIEMTPRYRPYRTTPAPDVGNARAAASNSCRSMLRPHDAEHGELEVVRFAAVEPPADRVEFLVGHPEPAVERFGPFHGGFRDRHRAAAAASVWAVDVAAAALSTNERRMPSPSLEPRIGSHARSGCGMRPATFPAAFITRRWRQAAFGWRSDRVVRRTRPRPRSEQTTLVSRAASVFRRRSTALASAIASARLNRREGVGTACEAFAAILLESRKSSPWLRSAPVPGRSTDWSRGDARSDAVGRERPLPASSG